VSIHNNAGGNPITTKGVSTYYRHIGYRLLSETILKRMLELDVENFGLVGSFNFALNSITEYPNVLVEGLFMSNPEDEAKLADPRFKRNLSRQIVRGIEDFIKQSK
jgi:N-acetylmuramoyl-L-alanine amidase